MSLADQIEADALALSEVDFGASATLTTADDQESGPLTVIPGDALDTTGGINAGLERVKMRKFFLPRQGVTDAIGRAPIRGDRLTLAAGECIGAWDIDAVSEDPGGWNVDAYHTTLIPGGRGAQESR